MMEGAETATETRRNGKSHEVPRTTVAKLLEDVAQILEESLPTTSHEHDVSSGGGQLALF